MGKCTCSSPFNIVALISCDTSRIRLPSGLLILLRRLHRVRCCINPPTSNDKISPPSNRRLRRLILLPQFIPLGRKIHSRRKNNKILLLRSNAILRRHLPERPRRHKSQHKALEFPRVVHRCLGIFTRSQRSLRGHLSQNQQATFGAVGEVRGGGGLRERVYDALTGEDAAVDDVRPFGDAEGAAVVLLLNGVADVDELAVFEDEEVVLFCKGLEPGDRFLAEVGEDVDVRFYHGDVRAQACESITGQFRFALHRVALS